MSISQPLRGWEELPRAIWDLKVPRGGADHLRLASNSTWLNFELSSRDRTKKLQMELALFCSSSASSQTHAWTYVCMFVRFYDARSSFHINDSHGWCFFLLEEISLFPRQRSCFVYGRDGKWIFVRSAFPRDLLFRWSQWKNMLRKPVRKTIKIISLAQLSRRMIFLILKEYFSSRVVMIPDVLDPVKKNFYTYRVMYKRILN